MTILEIKFNNKSNLIDFDSTHVELRELLAEIWHLDKNDILGFQDSFSNFFTLDSLISNEQYKFFSTSFTLVSKHIWPSLIPFEKETRQQEVYLYAKFDPPFIIDDLNKRGLITNAEFSKAKAKLNNLKTLSIIYKLYIQPGNFTVIQDLKEFLRSDNDLRFVLNDCLFFVSLLNDKDDLQQIVKENESEALILFSKFELNFEIEKLASSLRNLQKPVGKDLLVKLLSSLGQHINSFRAVMLKRLNESNSHLIHDLYNQSKIVDEKHTMIEIIKHTIYTYLDQTFFSKLSEEKRSNIKQILDEKNEKLYSILADSNNFHNQKKMVTTLNNFLLESSYTIKEIKFKSPSTFDISKFIRYIRIVNFLTKFQKENIIGMVKYKDNRLRSILNIFQRKKNFSELKQRILECLRLEFDSMAGRSFDEFVDEELVGSSLSYHEGCILKSRYKMLDETVDNLWDRYKETNNKSVIKTSVKEYLLNSEIKLNKEKWPEITPNQLREDKKLLFKTYDLCQDEKIILSNLAQNFVEYGYLNEEEYKDTLDIIEFEDENLLACYDVYKITQNHEELAEDFLLLLKMYKHRTIQEPKEEERLSKKEKLQKVLFIFFQKNNIEFENRKHLIKLLDERNKSLIGFIEFFKKNRDEMEFKEKIEMLLQ